MGHQLNYLYAATQESRGVASWSSAPMQVPEFGGFKPLKYFADQEGLQPYPYKLSFQRGGEPSVFADQGFDVYLYLDRGGNIHLQAPALNMLDLVNQSITGRREEVYDVVLGEPDPSLFLPPPGVSMTHQTEPRGMKMKPRQ